VVQLELIHIYFLLATPLPGVMLTLPMTLWVLKSMTLVFLKKRRGAEELTASLHVKFSSRRSMMSLVEIFSSSLLGQFMVIFAHFLK